MWTSSFPTARNPGSVPSSTPAVPRGQEPLIKNSFRSTFWILGVVMLSPLFLSASQLRVSNARPTSIEVSLGSGVYSLPSGSAFESSVPEGVTVYLSDTSGTFFDFVLSDDFVLGSRHSVVVGVGDYQYQREKTDGELWWYGFTLGSVVGGWKAFRRWTRAIHTGSD